MKQLTMFFAVLFAVMTISACGDDDKGKEETFPAPSVVSMTPQNGTTDLEPGDIEVSVTYDQDVKLMLSRINAISVTGATIGKPMLSGRTLKVTLTCPDYGTTVLLNLPSGIVANSQGTFTPAYTLTFTTRQRTPDEDDGHETAAEAVKKMLRGWNLGNTLDAWADWIPAGSPLDKYETCWGQPVTEAYLMQQVRAKGFEAMRIPVTWFQHMDENNIVDSAWMDRVEQVVNYVLDAGMYCILNVHHDTGDSGQAWLKAETSSFATYEQRFRDLWIQIATRFRDYDERLLFEGYNEMLAGSTTTNNAQWNEPKNSSGYTAINNFARTFVEAVRATGGGNEYRNLVVSTYSASHGTKTLQNLAIPTDPCGNQNHIAVEVHSYDPWNWVKTYNYQWTAACRKVIETMFKDLDTYFIAKGYPVIIGEYGPNGELNIDKNSTDAAKQQAGHHAADMVRLCKQYGIAAFYWMCIIDGNDRKQESFRWSVPQVADSIMAASR